MDHIDLAGVSDEALVRELRSRCTVLAMVAVKHDGRMREVADVRPGVEVQLVAVSLIRLRVVSEMLFHIASHPMEEDADKMDQAPDDDAPPEGGS